MEQIIKDYPDYGYSVILKEANEYYSVEIIEHYCWAKNGVTYYAKEKPTSDFTLDILEASVIAHGTITGDGFFDISFDDIVVMENAKEALNIGNLLHDIWLEASKTKMLVDGLKLKGNKDEQ